MSQRRAVFKMFLALSFVAFFLLPRLGYAQNAVSSINVTQTGTIMYVKIGLKSKPSSIPRGFSVATPPRIAVDLEETINSTGRTTQDVDQGVLRNLNVVTVGNKTRVVFNLKATTPYEISVVDDAVVVTLTPATGTPSTKAQGSMLETPDASIQAGLRDIDFRRMPDGTGRVIVELSQPNTDIDIQQRGQQIMVDFKGMGLPENLHRRLDVTDFGTPVQTINAFAQGGNTRLVVEPKGLWEHNAYQTDTQFIIEIKPIKEDPNKLVQGSRGGYSGEKLSIMFNNVEVRSILNVIADFTGLNIIASDTVTGTLTLRLKDVPWDQALDIILQTRGLDMRKNGNVILIAPADELSVKEKLALEQQAQIADLEPVRAESFQLNYNKATDVQTMLRDPRQSLLSKRGAVAVDARTNQVFVQDVPSRLEQIRRLITKIDIPVRQVLIEARIVEASDTWSKNLGAKFGINGSGTSSNGIKTYVGGNLNQTSYSSGQSSTSPTFSSDSLSYNGAASGINGTNAGQIALTIGNSSSTKFINLELSALEADGKGKILSNPRVLTADQVEASVEQGTELPYQQSTSSGATSVSFRKANLSLKVKPQITPEGAIILDVAINKDSVGQSTSAGYAIDTKAVKTQVLVENGGTVVIGGIYTQTINDSLTKIPFFGDLPVLGHLFRTSKRQDDKSELLVFITPRVVSDRLSLH